MANGVYIDGGGTVTAVVYGYGGQVPAGASFVAMDTEGVAVGQMISTVAQAAQAAFSAGLQITSTATPALNGKYAVDAAAQARVMAQMIALLNSNGAAFADGTASTIWPDMAGVTHTFDAAQFKTFALAVGAYVAALYKCVSGAATELPAAQATIA